MAILTKPLFGVDEFIADINTKDYAIGGKLITAQLRISQLEQMDWDEDRWRQHMREKLAIDLAKFILSNNLCEITSMDDPLSMDKLVYARCYLAPNDQVKILRTMGLK